MNYGRSIHPAYFQGGHRNQPYQNQQGHSMEWYPYQQPNPYYQGAYQQSYSQSYSPYDVPFQPAGMPQQTHNTSGQYPPKDAQFLFQNPLQPKEEMWPNQYSQQMNGYPVMNPYPKPNGMLKQPGGIQSLMNSFKSQDGTVDVNKMVNTAGQMVNAVTQVSSLVKGLGGIFKA